MSRIGKKPIIIPDSVKALVQGNSVTASGPKGQMQYQVHKDLVINYENSQILLTPRNSSQAAQSMWGMSRTRLVNIFDGVSRAFEKKLEIVGVGYRASMQGKNLHLLLGYSHEVVYIPPSGVSLSVPKPTEILVSGIDKQQVGQVAADIRFKRPPESYKGKGIRCAGEKVVRKEGKKK